MHEITNHCHHSHDITGELVVFNQIMAEVVSSNEDKRAHNTDRPNHVFNIDEQMFQLQAYPPIFGRLIVADR